MPTGRISWELAYLLPLLLPLLPILHLLRMTFRIGAHRTLQLPLF